MKKKKEEENENKKKHEINKNEATLRERIVLIFRILIQMFLSLQKKRKKCGKSDRAVVVFVGGFFFGLKVGRACFYQSDTAWSQHLQEFFHCTTKKKKKTLS